MKTGGVGGVAGHICGTFGANRGPGGGAEGVFLVFLVLATQSQRHNC